jgi:hypothetical protein
MAKYILLEPKEPTAGDVSLAPQFQSKTSVFPLSNWEVQDPLEQEWSTSACYVLNSSVAAMPASGRWEAFKGHRLIPRIDVRMNAA